jgi:hypothetical protein
VHVQHQPEVRQVHLGEGLVAQDAGVVHQDVDASPAAHRVGHHGLHRGLVGDRGAVGHRGAAGRLDLSHHRFGGGEGLALGRAAEVVDHDPRSPRGQCQRMLSAQAPARAGDDGHLAVESDAHRVPSR